jgi:hypothetical protein
MWDDKTDGNLGNPHYCFIECIWRNYTMSEEQLPELPEELGVYIDKPYGGLFGDTKQTILQKKIIEEIVADPYRDYRPHYFEEMTGASVPSIRKALLLLSRV